MKATFELPDDLVKEIKLRAVRDGQKLKDAVTDLLRKGLNAPADLDAHQPQIETDPRTGLPIVVFRHPVSSAPELTPQRVSDILLEQEVAWHHEATR